MIMSKIKLLVNQLLRKIGLKMTRFDESEYEYRNILLDYIKNNSELLHG